MFFAENIDLKILLCRQGLKNPKGDLKMELYLCRTILGILNMQQSFNEKKKHLGLCDKSKKGFKVFDANL